MGANEIIYKSAAGIYENTAEIQVSLEGNAQPLLNVTRITCKLTPCGELVDSVDSPLAISWTDEGVITFDFKEHSFDTVPSGVQSAALVAFDPAHLGGQVIVHDTTEELTFNFIS